MKEIDVAVDGGAIVREPRRGSSVTARRLLVVITSEVADEALRDLVRSRAGDDAEMLVVAPAVSALAARLVDQRRGRRPRRGG